MERAAIVAVTMVVGFAAGFVGGGWYDETAIWKLRYYDLSRMYGSVPNFFEQHHGVTVPATRGFDFTSPCRRYAFENWAETAPPGGRSGGMSVEDYLAQQCPQDLRK